MRFKLEGLQNSGGWSVDDLCPKCGENKSECSCNESKELIEPSKHSLVFRLEKRNGKPVTVVYPFFVEEVALKETLLKLKKSLGVGGAIKSNEIELQGDIKEKVRNLLEKMEFKFRKN